MVDRSLANGLQAFAGERYTRKIQIGDCMRSPSPTTPNPQRRYAGYILVTLPYYRLNNNVFNVLPYSCCVHTHPFQVSPQRFQGPDIKINIKNMERPFHDHTHLLQVGP